MFKVARFKVHNPSRHKQTMLWYALTRYHETMKCTLEKLLSDPNFEAQACPLDKSGKPRPNRYAVEKLVRSVTPKSWPLAPVRDYLISDAAAMLLSHLNKQHKGLNKSNPPTMPSLEPMSAPDYSAAYERFSTETFAPKPEHAAKIAAALERGDTRVARRLERIQTSWAASRAAGDILRRLDGAMPRPIEFRHSEFERGCFIARRGNDYFALVRLFSKEHKYIQRNVLAEGFVDWRTRESIAGRVFPGIILPLEFNREYHDQEFLQHGRPQAAKLLAKRTEDGGLEFFIHVAFEFAPEPVECSAVLGIDRGAAKIASATIVDLAGNAVQRGLTFEGAGFSAEMARLRQRIAHLQRRGIQRSRVLRVRGRKADALVGEYANRLVAYAMEHRARIAIEKLNAVSIARFLTQSQFSKLKDALVYKGARFGLPEPLEVPAAFTSQTCAACGHRAAENRPKRDAQGKSIQNVFRCVQCGYACNADDNASEIISLRAVHQLQHGGKFQKFEAFQLWLRSLRGRDGCRASSAAAQ